MQPDSNVSAGQEMGGDGHRLPLLAWGHICLPIMLLVTKFIEVANEPDQDVGGELVLLAAARRLDDASFWGVIAATVAMIQIARVVALRSVALGRAGHNLWLISSAVALATYGLAAWLNKGTFFWGSDSEPVVRLLQFVEGFIHVIAIVVGNYFMAAGTVTARHLQRDALQLRRVSDGHKVNAGLYHRLVRALGLFYVFAILPPLVLPTLLGKVVQTNVVVEPFAAFLVASLFWCGVVPFASVLAAARPAA